MFSAVAFIESIPRGKLTSNESSCRNHAGESWQGWHVPHVELLARGTREKEKEKEFSNGARNEGRWTGLGGFYESRLFVRSGELALAQVDYSRTISGSRGQ
jgi:hypothetical protein